MRSAPLAGLAILAIDIAYPTPGPTPLALALAVVGLAAVGGLLMTAGALALPARVDRRWPPDEQMSPGEVLWGEYGGYVQDHFPGLDPNIARDLTPYLDERHFPAGVQICELGAPASHYHVITKGTAEVLAPDEEAGRELGPGDTFGDDAILAASPNRVSVAAKTDCEVMMLPAEDYLAAIALGADGDEDYVRTAVAGRLRAEVPAEPEPATAPPPPGPHAPPPGPADFAATHVVVAEGLSGYVLPAGPRPSRELAEGTPVIVFETLPEWAHVTDASGWQGWVKQAGLEPAGGDGQ